MRTEKVAYILFYLHSANSHGNDILRETSVFKQTKKKQLFPTD